MGNPPSIQDSDITLQLPAQRGHGHEALTMDLHVQLSQLLAQIINSNPS